MIGMSDDTLFKPNETQLQILRLLRVGATDRTIALKLHISERTVREHLHKVCNAIGIQGRFALGIEAALRGWVD